jgi:hypothetical protein
MENTILINRWGATMILVDFYIVLKETAKTLTIQELHSKEVGDGGFLTGTATPTDLKIGKQFKVYKENSVIDNRPIFTGHLDKHYKQYLEVWDGKPAHFNHCD